MSPPTVAGIQIPPVKLATLSANQLAALTPFERTVWQRLDDGAKATLELRTAVEVLVTSLGEQHKATEKRERLANRRTYWASGGFATIVVAGITVLGTVWVESIKAAAIHQADSSAKAQVDERAPQLEERATIRSQELARAILDEQERRAKQQPLKRDPDLVTLATPQSRR